MACGFPDSSCGSRESGATIESVSTPTETARVNTEEVQIRRSPKYGTFMALGAGLGIVIGVILAVTQPALGEYSIEQIVGLLALMLGAIGLGVGAAVALLFDRLLARKTLTVEAKRTTVEPTE